MPPANRNREPAQVAPGYRVLAEATMVVHFGYLAYVMACGFLA